MKLLLWVCVVLFIAGSPTPSLALGGGADGEFEKRVSSHFVLYQDVDIDQTGGLRGSRNFENRILETLEGAFRLVDTLLGLRPRRAIYVTVYDPTDFDARFAGLFRFPAAGFYGESIHIRGGTVLDARLVRVLHHEYVHAAFHAEAPSLVLPAWLNEGLSEWIEAHAGGQRGLSPNQYALLANMASQDAFYSLAQLSVPSFGRFSPRAAAAAYLESYAFIDYLARNYGERRLREWVRSLVRGGDVERSLRKAYRADLGQLEQRFVASFKN
ncbi:MAG: hypothetical protein VX246_13355 [Myxococcota bacterium]|nr:hypothetical protein [Myxococcota bacterium]